MNAFCRNGHTLTEETTRQAPDGTRSCRVCERTRCNAWKDRNKDLVRQKNRERMARIRAENPEVTRERSRRWVKENPEKHKRIQKETRLRRRSTARGRAMDLLRGARKRSKMLGMECSLSLDRIERVLADGVCEVTGIPFEVTTNGRKSPWSATLDKTKNDSGYTDQNTKVVVWAYNVAKQTWDPSVVLRVAKALLGNEPS